MIHRNSFLLILQILSFMLQTLNIEVEHELNRSLLVVIRPLPSVNQKFNIWQEYRMEAEILGYR